MLRKEDFVKNLDRMVSDTQTALNRAAAPLLLVNNRDSTKQVLMNPFEDVYQIVYKLTMRTVGVSEFADDPDMLKRTLGWFETILASSSPARIMFPWLWTPGHVKRLIAGARLYGALSKVVKDRVKMGIKKDDALDYLLRTGAGEDMTKMLTVKHSAGLPTFLAYLCFFAAPLTQLTSWGGWV